MASDPDSNSAPDPDPGKQGEANWRRRYRVRRQSCEPKSPFPTELPLESALTPIDAKRHAPLSFPRRHERPGAKRANQEDAVNPIAMAVVILGLTGAFLWSASQRWGLLRVGASPYESRFGQIFERLKAVWTFAFFQKKMRYYLWAGLAHQLIFLGFVVLLLRSLMLWGRGFDPAFDFWVLGPHQSLGQIYGFLKDTFAGLVLLGVSVFVYYRVIKPQKRMALSFEGLVILGIIAVMMIADITYDGAAIALNHKFGSACNVMDAWCTRASTVVAPYGAPAASIQWTPYPDPAGSLSATLLKDASVPTLVVLAHVGFWTHSSLVLIFLNILPYSKHFHIITAVPNVFLTDLTPKGRLKPLAKSSEELMAQVEKAGELDDMLEARIGYARIEHFSWKDILDFYTCTECGRCSDNCPAATTGKILSPKFLTLDLRDHLYARQEEFLELGEQKADAPAAEEKKEGDEDDKKEPEADPKANGESAKPAPVNLVPNVIHPDVLWACTTCRACEEFCPVMITYVDKIVQMRRNLVMVRGESFPSELMNPLSGIQTNGNPWNLSRVDRTNWAEGLDIPRMADKPEAEVLYWVGCAASYDDRAKKIARATASLLQMAGVDFAILGDEETCTGDPARRGGDEATFLMQAEANTATLNGYQEKGGIRRIITTCPHCFNTPVERVSGLRREVRGRPSHGLPAGASGGGEAQSQEPRRGAGRLSRLLLPRPLQRHLRSAAGHPVADPRRRARGSGVLDEEQGPLLRGGRRSDVPGRAEQRSRQHQAHETADGHGRQDHRQRLSLLHDDDHRRHQGRVQRRVHQEPGRGRALGGCLRCG